MSESGDRPGGTGQEDPTQGAFDAARDPWARPPEEPTADETVKLTKDQPGGAGAAPRYEPPSVEPPRYEPPSAEPPRYEPPSAEPPTYTPPDYQSPAYGQPSYQPPVYPTPAAQQPSYEPPTYQPPASYPPSYSDPNQPGGYGQPYAQQGYGSADPYPQYGQQGYGQPYGAQPYGSPGYGAPAYPAPGYPGGAYGYGGPTTSGKATAVMVLGIASLVTLCVYGLGIVPGIIALVMSGSAKREIENSGGRLTGLGMVTAGRVTSWIAVGLTVLTIAIVIAIVILAPDGSSTYNGN